MRSCWRACIWSVYKLYELAHKIPSLDFPFLFNFKRKELYIWDRAVRSNVLDTHHPNAPPIYISIAHPSMIIQAGKEIGKRAPFAFSEETKSLYKQSKYGNCFCQTRSFLHNFRRQHPNIYFNFEYKFLRIHDTHTHQSLLERPYIPTMQREKKKRVLATNILVIFH